MTEIYIPKSLKECAGVYTYEYTGPFYECTNLKTVHFEEGLTEIADSLFLGCPGIEEIVIPETVTVIEGNAFQYARKSQLS